MSFIFTRAIALFVVRAIALFVVKGDRTNPIILNQWQIDGDKTTA
ncbi:hypothetical protein [Microcoleus sp.]